MTLMEALLALAILLIAIVTAKAIGMLERRIQALEAARGEYPPLSKPVVTASAAPPAPQWKLGKKEKPKP